MSKEKVKSKKKTTKKEEIEKLAKYFPDLYDRQYDYFNSPRMEELIKSTNSDVINTTYLGNYSGDALMILRRDNKFGLLIFGYGSCSGCDALKACNDYKDLYNLREALHKSVIWKEYTEFVEYLKDKDWDAEFYCAGDKKRTTLIKQFVKESKSKMLMTHLSGI